MAKKIDEAILYELNDFVAKIKSGEKQIDPKANNIRLEHGDVILGQWLATTMSDFEFAKEHDYGYENTVEHFHEMVRQAMVHDVIIDNKLRKELEECRQKQSDLDLANRNLRILNEKFVSNEINLRTTLNDIYEHYPSIKKHYQKTEESEITDG